jgi:hypothetical protein
MATGLEHIFIIIFNGYQQGIQQMRVKLWTLWGYCCLEIRAGLSLYLHTVT